MDSPFAKEIEIAIATLQQAALLAQSIITSTDKGVIQKTDAEHLISPVTVADFAIQALLSATFRHHFPSDTLVGEESAADLRANPALLDRVWTLLEEVSARAQPSSLFRVPSDKGHACDLMDACGEGKPGPGRVWVFDPIDGTETFMRGEMYAVNVALLQDSKQVLGVAGCPKLSVDATSPITDASTDPTGRGAVLFAVKGHGTYIRALHSAGAEGDVTPRKLDPHPREHALSDLRLVTCMRATDSGSLEFHKAVASAVGMDYPGCDLVPWVVRWVALAMGLANTTVWLYNSAGRRGKLWDHAGAMLLFEEVGGKITDAHGRDIDFGAGRLLEGNLGFVASLRGLHDVVLEKTQAAMREFGRGDLLRE